jgi:hypothetical protein
MNGHIHNAKPKTKTANKGKKKEKTEDQKLSS